MEEIKTIDFVDAETQDTGVAVVRAGNGVVSLSLSLSSDGDIEVFFPSSICRSLIAVLNEGVIKAAEGD